MVSCFLFSYPIFSQSPSPNHNHQTVNGNNASDRSIYQAFIEGIWRGFHETEDVTVYYGYQFRPDGTFWARHRIYQAQQTIDNTIWQGQWEFNNNILTITGINEADPRQSLSIQFQVTNTFTLRYQQGSLPDIYQSMTLNKISVINR